MDGALEVPKEWKELFLSFEGLDHVFFFTEIFTFVFHSAWLSLPKPENPKSYFAKP